MLQDLQWFYDNLDASSVSFSLPQIYRIQQYENLIGVIERRIDGHPMSELLPSYDSEEVRTRYVTSSADLALVRILKPLDRYMLFDIDHVSSMSIGDWNLFLRFLLQRKLQNVKAHLESDVLHFRSRVDKLLNCLLTSYTGPIGIIHGDLYPGNILVNDEKRVSGVIDFGTFSMVGDPLFDVATSWAFYNMYGSDRVATRKELLETVVARHGRGVTPVLYRYLLAFAILSCDLYPETTCSIRDTGHYQWAIEILRDGDYWTVGTQESCF